MRRLAPIALALVAASTVHAGDREVEIVLVNMTPDAASSEASKRCVKAIEKKLSADYTHVVRMGETPLRKLAGKTAGEPFLSWPAAALQPARQRGDGTVDALVLVDCRPDARTLDVLVSPPAPGLVTFAARHVAVDKPVIDLAADAILRRAVAGFVP